jgi:hypothetical protein
MLNRDYTSLKTNATRDVGVLTDTEILLVERLQGKRHLRSLPLLAPIHETTTLLNLLWETELSCIWVMPGSMFSQSMLGSWFEQASATWISLVHPDPHESSRPLTILLWPRNTLQQASRRLTLVFPEHAGWPWELTDARSLLATISYLQQVLTIPVSDSPDLLASHLLTKWTRNLPTPQQSSFPTGQHALHSYPGNRLSMTLKHGHEVAWLRPLTLEEERQRYLHKYIHFSHTLETCKSLLLGTGEVQHSPNGRAFDGQRPGTWRVKGERAGSIFDGTRLPTCLSGEWMSTAQVICCRDISYRIHVEEGFFWPHSDYFLKEWATTLWQAGGRLQTNHQIYRHGQARNNAMRAIQMLTQSGIHLLTQEEGDGGWSHPDWKAQIAGGRQANLFAHLVSLARKGIMPVLIEGDAFWIVSPDPNPLSAAPGLLTARTWRGFIPGYEAPLPLSSEIRTAFRQGNSAEQVSNMLDTLAGEVFPL